MRSTPGRRYGGSSSVNADASPRRTVRESALETSSVNSTPMRTMASTAPAAAMETNTPENCAPTKIVASTISVGKRPLQGMKLLVRMAMSRSRGESMTRVAMTPGGVAAQAGAARWARANFDSPELDF